MRRLRRAALLALGAAILSPAAAHSQDALADFYRGKQITLTVSTSPGGSASLYAQALSHQMGRFIPGNPSIIVQHMPGAGGLVATNNAALTMPRDGTAIVTTSRTEPLEPLMGNQNAKFDPRQFNWLGTANVEYTTCIAWHTAKVKTLADAFVTPLVVGGYGTEGISTIFPKAANALAGTKFKVVTGYQGSPEILLAMERGEVEGFCAIGWTYLKLRKADWLAEKKINILFQMADKHPDNSRCAVDHRQCAHAGGPRRIRSFVRAAENGPAVFHAAAGSARAGSSSPHSVRAHLEGPAIPRRDRQNGT
jgi:hypothetical protein